MSTLLSPLLLLPLILVSFALVSASIGDERESFVNCVKSCASDLCNLPLLLRLTQWTCQSDCQYRCMRLDVLKDRLEASRIVQYFGKWPFVRILGAQEIFSVLFSLGNFAACLYGYFRIYKKRRSQDWMANVHLVSLFITCNTWLQSAIFHYRDTWITEKLDYFSACLCILSTVPSAAIRTFEIKKPRDQLKLVIPMLIIYLQHVTYMLFVEFDYGYNIKFNAVFGVLSNVLWIRYALKHQNKEMKRKYLLFVGANVVSMLMVAIDFPPFFDLIDMHALWHLSTIPITLMWYKLITDDTNQNQKLKRK